MTAVRERLSSGPMPGMATELEVDLARKVQQHMACAEMVRFVNTGTEATLMAIRVARAYRKRDKIAKFEGNYDCQHDLVQVSTNSSAGPADAPEPSLDHIGVAQSTLRDVVILPYNDPERAAALISAPADELAAVIVEPVAGFGMGCVPATREFIRAVREVTAKHDIPLILDEVVTNFRLGLGGASDYNGIKPDMVTLGKILGGRVPDRRLRRPARPDGSFRDADRSAVGQPLKDQPVGYLLGKRRLRGRGPRRHQDLGKGIGVPPSRCHERAAVRGLEETRHRPRRDADDYRREVDARAAFRRRAPREPSRAVRRRPRACHRVLARPAGQRCVCGTAPVVYVGGLTQADVDTILEAAGRVLSEIKPTHPAGVAGGQA